MSETYDGHSTVSKSREGQRGVVGSPPLCHDDVVQAIRDDREAALKSVWGVSAHVHDPSVAARR